ncbi:polysaccharide transporter, PST family [Aquimarina amphilecti]|uniref:Polysaccharide transporter, PST family n=1 Tax=Aquimarina amphilecti TaxID=1038014 RepID=A0A1H7WBG7_AQUAM|nr:O-antigen translocase [Aquimarina amphilecti]SEM18831.1 polysaccharide transporter, PST family [Aquimarina amphilecti]
MDSYFDKLKNNVLIKVSSFNAISVFAKMITGFISLKVVAIFLGPEGLALIGNLRNVLTSIQSVGTLGLYNGIVKYIAEFKSDKEETKSMLSTSYLLCFVITIVMSIWLYFFPTFWNNLVFGSSYQYNFVFKAIAIALPFYSVNTLCLAIINGYSKYKIYILLNIASSILGLLITVFLVWEYKLEGAFLAIIINPAVSLFLTILIILNKKDVFKFLPSNKISFKYVKRLSSFAIMALVSVTILPAILIRIRNFIITTEGIKEAGYWEAIQSISSQYMLFITTLLTIYLLPKLAEIKKSKDFRLEIINFYKTILPVFIVGFLIIYFLRNIIIKVLFSNEFIEMEPLFIWQLFGDLFKIASLVIAYQFLAKRMFWYYIITEIISFAFLYLASIYLINQFGFIGASMAYFFNYVFYFLLLIVVFRKSFFGPDKNI